MDIILQSLAMVYYLIFPAQQYNDQGNQLMANIVQLQKNKNYAECIKLIDQAIIHHNRCLIDQRSPGVISCMRENASLLWFCRAECHYSLERYDESLSDCENALDLNANNCNVYYLKAFIHEQLGDEKMSMACMILAAQNGHRKAKELVIANRIS